MDLWIWSLSIAKLTLHIFMKIFAANVPIEESGVTHLPSSIAYMICVYPNTSHFVMCILCSHHGSLEFENDHVLKRFDQRCLVNCHSHTMTPPTSFGSGSVYMFLVYWSLYSHQIYSTPPSYTSCPSLD